MTALQMRAFDAKLMILTFGVGGTIYTQTSQDMQSLGISSTSITKTLRAIHLHSVQCATGSMDSSRLDAKFDLCDLKLKL